jgi:GT2 family glycosyltransferase
MSAISRELMNHCPTPATACCVVVLTCNGRELLRACLQSLGEQTYTAFETLVVTNGSNDGSTEMLAREFPEVRVIALPENRGFSIANNAAMRDVLAREIEYVLLLNDDTVAGPACVEELLAAMQTDVSIAAVSPKIYFASEPDRFWYAGADFSLWTAHMIQRGWRKKDAGQFDNRVEVTAVTGCAVLLRASALQEVGLLDESLWAYLEDVEWSIRFQRHGYGLRFAPKARVWHHCGATWVRVLGGGSQARRQYYSTRNIVLIGWKHARWWQMPTYALGVLVNELAFYSALRIWRKDYRALWSIYSGIGAALRRIVFDSAYSKREYPVHG